MNAPNLDGWVPFRVYGQGPNPMVEWCYLGEQRFTEPFFETTIQYLIERPFRIMFRHRTPIEVLEQRAQSHPGIPPTGFIFHLSRCGSTLISQMLAASPANVVISEGLPLQSVLSAATLRPGLSSEEHAGWFRSLVHCLAQPRAGGESRFFIKFDAWQILALPLIRRAFPETPWIFVYRDPAEVLASQLGSPAMFTILGVSLGCFNPFSLAEAVTMDPCEYASRILAAIANAGLRSAGTGRGMLVNYTDLPAAVFSTVAAHFGCPWSGEEVAAMEAASGYNTKMPSQPFAPDGQLKRHEADPRVRQLAAQWLDEIYLRLEERRVAMAAGGAG
jgi:hypothetical protein